MATEAQKRADANYKKRNVTQVGVAFYPADAELLEWLRAQPNKAGYIKGLIKKDMEERK